MSDDGPRIRIEWPKLRAPEHMSDFRPGLWRKLTMAHMYRQFATYDHDAFLERTGRTSDDARAPSLCATSCHPAWRPRVQPPTRTPIAPSTGIRSHAQRAAPTCSTAATSPCASPGRSLGWTPGSSPSTTSTPLVRPSPSPSQLARPRQGGAYRRTAATSQGATHRRAPQNPGGSSSTLPRSRSSVKRLPSSR